MHDETENKRFASGANGDLLIADSAQPTGLRWESRRVGASNGLSIANADWGAGDTATIALPGTTKGDLIVHNGSTNVRQPAAVDGQSIFYDSPQSAGIRADGLQLPNFTPVNTAADNLPASAVLMDAATGTILYGRDAKLGNWPASTTKILMEFLVAENNPALDATVTIDATDISSIAGGSSICNVQAGPIYTTAELLKGMMIPSGNDCAQLRFYSTQVKAYMVRFTNRGQAAFGVDGDTEAVVDTCWPGAQIGDQLMYTSPVMPLGCHYHSFAMPAHHVQVAAAQMSFRSIERR